MKVSKKTILGILMAFLCTFAIARNLGTVSAATKEDTIVDGVTVDGIEIGTMTEEEAQQKLDEYVQELKAKKVTVVLDSGEVVKTVGELGYTCDEHTFIQQAMEIGKTGNLIKRYKEIKDVKEKGTDFSLHFTLDEATVREFVEKECTKDDVPAVNAGISRVNGGFVYTDSSVGRKCDVNQTISLISESILTDWDHQDIKVAAVMREDDPKYTRADVEQVKDVLGSFTTNYASSTMDRKKNVANGASLINNTVVYPGETFSCYEVLNPFTLENGYAAAGAYVNGMVEDSIGGGVCQVSTTLYNAVLYSELEIVQRANHSMIVSYVDLARDAAIAGTYKDLKFKNNTQTPVLIEAITNGTTITFNIYGKETRPSNRKVEYVSKMIQKIEHGPDVITEDKTKPSTYRKVTQSYHDGYIAELYKVVYVDGVEVSRELVNKSTYSASPNYITIGAKVEEEEKEDVKDKDKDEDKEDQEATKDEDQDKDKDKDQDKTNSKDEETTDSKDEVDKENSSDKDANQETSEKNDSGEQKSNTDNKESSDKTDKTSKKD